MIMIDGRIINNTENSPHNYMFRQGNEEKKSFLRMAISSRKPGSKKGADGYYPTNLWSVKAFGVTAEQINTYWGPGKRVVISGELDMSEEYTSPENGTTYPPRPEIIASRVWFADGPADTQTDAPHAATTTKQTNARPVAKAASQRRVPF